MIIFSDNSEKQEWPDIDPHDPDTEREYTLYYYLPTWLPSTAYTKDKDIIVPPTPNGCMYYCTSGGISSADVPLFITKECKSFEDNDVTWRCMPLETLLSSGDTFTSTWSVNNPDIILTEDTIVDNIAARVKVSNIGNLQEPITSFELTNTINITYLAGNTEVRQKTLIIPVRTT